MDTPIVLDYIAFHCTVLHIKPHSACLLLATGSQRQHGSQLQVQRCLRFLHDPHLLDNPSPIPLRRRPTSPRLRPSEDGRTDPGTEGDEAHLPQAEAIGSPAEEASVEGARLPAQVTRLLRPRPVGGFAGDERAPV